MLAIGAPHIDAWNAWYNATGNRPEGVGAAARPGRRGGAGGGSGSGGDRADRRGPRRLTGRPRSGPGRATPSAIDPPWQGDPETIADALRAYAREGIAHVQLVLDPITLASLEELAPILELLDRG